MKDVDNALQVQRQPGPLVDVLAGHVVQYYALDAPVPVTGQLGPGSTAVWAETLEATDAATKVLMSYGASEGPSWFSGKPAALTRGAGKGRITYVGATLDKGLMQKLAAWALHGAAVKPILGDVPAGVELMQRVNGKGDRVWVLINHGDAAQTVNAAGVDLLTGTSVTRVDLAPHGVAVVRPAGSK